MMKGSLFLLVVCLQIAAAMYLPVRGTASDYWQTPFDTIAAAPKSTDSTLTLDDAFRLAAAYNPTLRALNFQHIAAAGRLEQAGLWSNPEFGIEFEEVGWDAPGFRESEMIISVAQEFDLFGRRGARKRLAQAHIEATASDARISAFDLYLEVKRRFYSLAYAQQRLRLSQISVAVADEIARNIDFRIEKGAALQSESLLARLEQQRTRLTLEQARREAASAETALLALWGARPRGVIAISETEPNLDNIVSRIASVSRTTDSARTVLKLHRQSAIVHAERLLAAAEARPGIMLSGGYKRLEADNSNSFLIGISIPLPFFDRNQGTRKSLQADLRVLEYQIDRERLETDAQIGACTARLDQLIHSHDVLDSLLVPTAELAYETLRRAYESGRVPYSQLLEAERSLNDLRFEHNDMLLAIREQILALENLTGQTFRIDKEM